MCEGVWGKHTHNMTSLDTDERRISDQQLTRILKHWLIRVEFNSTAQTKFFAVITERNSQARSRNILKMLHSCRSVVPNTGAREQQE